MTERSARHETFTIRREYPYPPARVFAAWAKPEARAKWFVGPGGWQEQRRDFEFRPGGNERVVGRHADGNVSDFDARYLDIVPDARIVFSYVMHLNGTMISISLATVELAASAKNTKLTFTEHVIFLDAFDDPKAKGREEGTYALLDRLGLSLESQSA